VPSYQEKVEFTTIFEGEKMWLRGKARRSRRRGKRKKNGRCGGFWLKKEEREEVGEGGCGRARRERFGILQRRLRQRQESQGSRQKGRTGRRRGSSPRGPRVDSRPGYGATKKGPDRNVKKRGGSGRETRGVIRFSAPSKGGEKGGGRRNLQKGEKGNSRPGGSTTTGARSRSASGALSASLEKNGRGVAEEV